jgi:glutamate dehydrogenase
MAHPYHQDCQTLIDNILAHAPQDGLLRDFLGQFYDTLTRDDLQDIPPEIAVLLGQDVYAHVKQRSEQVPDIYIETPDYLKKHYGRTRVAITIINDDMPFLLDSLSNQLTALGFTIFRTIHPQLWAEREQDRSLKKLYINETQKPDVARNESCIYFEVSPLPEGLDANELKEKLLLTLRYVKHAVSDWRVMMAKAREVNTHLSLTQGVLSDAEQQESGDFFDWLLDKNFIFLGYAEYDFSNNDKQPFTPKQETALGILAIPESNLLQRGLATLPEEVRHFALQSNPIEITKSNKKSVVHRDVLMDYIGIKRFDEAGNVIGESRFLGLFTSNVYYQKASDIPYIRRKVSDVLEMAEFDTSGHSGKSLKATLEFFPRDELFQISTQDLFTISMGIVALEERPDIRAFFRRDTFERFMSCFIFMPRDKFNTFVRIEAGKVLEKHLQGTITAFYSQLTDSPLARVNYIIQTTPGKIPELDMATLNQELRFIINYWVDSLHDALLDGVGEKKAERLYREFGQAFPKNYINVTQIPHAIQDILRLKEVVKTGESQFHIFESNSTDYVHMKMYAQESEVALSDILPIIENLGFKVRDVQPHRITPVIKGEEIPLLLRDFNLIPQNGKIANFKAVKPLIEEIMLAAWNGAIENDRFNALGQLAGLNVRQITLLRAYQHYAKQAGLSYSDSYIMNTLTKHASVTAQLVALFEARFDPDFKGNRDEASSQLFKAIKEVLQHISNLAEDRILRYFADTIHATLRTNFYQLDAEGNPKPYMSFKFNSKDIPNLPLPHPFREIFVYSMTTEGIHLRAGKIARGGLRWSDRHEDFRTEVLGLMKAQVVKNTVIVPTGSKGGFVVKGTSFTGDRDAWQQAGIASYKEFLSGLLDITDNREGELITPPKRTVRYDEDDPYLVVAADKGTATFSDIANGVARQYSFWLDDAFASGGSVGYDHKKMAITARGAWISVQRHFAEMGKNVQTEPFTVAGIGDMSGDVFGNGMLRSEHILLQAAFNHLHIFIDPTPDAATSFKERERLFNLGRGSWDAYNTALISKGGGVFERSAKSINVTPEMQALLHTKETSMTPNQLIKLILKSPVELLWNGGIGTYVKSRAESDADVGDPSNNNLRINGDELRAKVIGEGGNLGFTQLGRIEYARAGGRINTDAIDNSAGVDCSDHEVNIKIGLRAAIQNKKLDVAARNLFLAEMTEDVAELVLQDNRHQNQALSIAASSAADMIEVHAEHIRELEAQGLLNREVEYLPNDKQLADLRASKHGLTRPELAVLMAYSKIALYKSLSTSKLVESEYLRHRLVDYFPKPMQERYKEALLTHPLSSEIVATTLTNSIINRSGISYIFNIQQDTGHEICDIVRAYVIVCDVFGLYSLWDEIEHLPHTVSAATQITLFSKITRFVERMSVWFLSNFSLPLDIETLVPLYADSIKAFVAQQDKFISDSVGNAYSTEVKELLDAAVPNHLAERVANLHILVSASDVAKIDHATKQHLEVIGTIYYELGARLQLTWLRYFIHSFPIESQWDRLAIRNAINTLYEQQRRLTQMVVESLCDDDVCETTITRWEEHNKGDIERFGRLIRNIKASATHDMSMVVVAMRQLASIKTQ